MDNICCVQYRYQHQHNDMEHTKGYIYVLTNPSFPDYVKIGYADNVETRLQQLNRSECIPFAFRVYAKYAVNSRLSDIKVHAIIDKLNPHLRSIENFNGQKRVREFYAMSAEDAYAVLEAMAEIHGYTDRLELVAPDAKEVEAEETAEDIKEARKERLTTFTFALCGIAPGSEIEFCCRNNPYSGAICKVIDDRNIEYENESWSLTALAKRFTGSCSNIAGTRYFKYRGEWLHKLRERLGV